MDFSWTFKCCPFLAVATILFAWASHWMKTSAGLKALVTKSPNRNSICLTSWDGHKWVGGCISDCWCIVHVDPASSVPWRFIINLPSLTLCNDWLRADWNLCLMTGPIKHNYVNKYMLKICWSSRKILAAKVMLPSAASGKMTNEFTIERKLWMLLWDHLLKLWQQMIKLSFYYSWHTFWVEPHFLLRSFGLFLWKDECLQFKGTEVALFI